MRKTVRIAGLVIVMTTGLFFCHRRADVKEAAIATPVVNDYPYMKLVMPDGSTRAARELPPKSILIVFFPDCDHCQREAAEISSHAKAFEKYQVWFISTATFADIDRFSKNYNLTGHSNIHFVRTMMPDIVNSFGSIPTPSVFIYSEEKRFVKAFKGETKIDEIIKFL